MGEYSLGSRLVLKGEPGFLKGVYPALYGDAISDLGSEWFLLF